LSPLASNQPGISVLQRPDVHSSWLSSQQRGTEASHHRHTQLARSAASCPALPQHPLAIASGDVVTAPPHSPLHTMTSPMTTTASTPRIRVYESGSSLRSSLSIPRPPPQSRPSEAMPIPRVRDDNVPPPLPPPRYIGELSEGQDVGWKWGNANNTHFGGVKPGSSLLGGLPSCPPSRSLESRSPDSFDGHSDEDHGRRSTTVDNRSVSRVLSAVADPFIAHS
jgi:hypothetical protein